MLTQDQTLTRPPGSIVTLSHLLSNTGNVASSYAIALANNAAGCSADTLDLSALRVLRDANNSSVSDPADPVLALDKPGALTLKPGEAAALLVQGTIPMVARGTACLGLTATTALQGLQASNRDTVVVGDAAALSLVKSASVPRFRRAGPDAHRLRGDGHQHRYAGCESRAMSWHRPTRRCW